MTPAEEKAIRAALERRWRAAFGAMLDAVTYDTEAVWGDLTLRLGHFTDHEKAELVRALLRSMTADEAYLAARSAWEDVGHIPDIAAFVDEPARLKHARGWARHQSQTTLKVFAIACGERLAPKTRQEFVSWASSSMKVAAE